MENPGSQSRLPPCSESNPRTGRISARPAAEGRSVRSLSVTVGAVIALFVLMQLTGKVDWERVLDPAGDEYVRARQSPVGAAKPLLASAGVFHAGGPGPAAHSGGFLIDHEPYGAHLRLPYGTSHSGLALWPGISCQVVRIMLST